LHSEKTAGVKPKFLKQRNLWLTTKHLCLRWSSCTCLDCWFICRGYLLNLEKSIEKGRNSILLVRVAQLSFVSCFPWGMQ